MKRKILVKCREERKIYVTYTRTYLINIKIALLAVAVIKLVNVFHAIAD